MFLLRRCKPHPSRWQRCKSDAGLNSNDIGTKSTCRHLVAPGGYQPAMFATGSSSLAFTTHTPFLLNNPARHYHFSPSSGKREGLYTQIGGPIDRKVCDLSEAEINNLLSARIRCKRARDFQRADQIREELRRSGVFVDDRSKEWRADGASSFTRRGPSKDPNQMPRMRDCQTMDEAISAIHDNLAKASNRDIAAFWAVVPTLLRKRGSGNRHHQSQQLVPQLSSIFNKTAEKIGTFGPRDLSTTTLAFAKIVDILEKRGDGPYHDCLQHILVDRKDIIFQFIAKASVQTLPQFDDRDLANLAYAYGLIGYLPKFDDGSTLFHHIAEKSLPLLGKFNPQNLSNLVWTFGKIGASHPALFGKVADHIVALNSLDAFNSQDISNTLNAFAKAGVSHTALFERVGDHIVALGSLDAFNSQDISNTLNAFAKAGVSHPSLFEKVAVHIVALGSLDEFKSQEISNTLNAFAKAGVSHPPLFEKVGDHIVALGSLDEFIPQHLANTVHAFAKAEVSHLPLFERVGDHIVALGSLDTFTPQALSNTVWAFAKVGAPHPALFEKVADHILTLRTLDDWIEQNILNVAWAYQKAGIENVPLSDKLTIAAVEKSDEFEDRTIKNFLRWTDTESDPQK